MSYRGRTHFRTTPGRLVVFTALSLAILAISITASTYEPAVWVRAFCWAIFFLSVVAIADLMLSYIDLGETDFRMRQNFRTRVIPKEDIESISAEKGCPLILRLRDGGHVELPDLAIQGIGNSLRAWIRAT